MDTLFASREKVMGLPPGSLVASSEPGAVLQKPRVTIMAYTDADLREELVLDPATALAAMTVFAGVTWLNIDGLGDPPLLNALGESLRLHPLTLEDALTLDQRPKVDHCDGYLYLVVKMLSLSPERELQSEQVSMVVGRNYLVTLQEQEGDVFDLIRNRLRQRQGLVRQKGADYLAYTLLDAIVDHYFVVLEHYSGQLEELDELVMRDISPDTLLAIQRVKQELSTLRRAAWPLRDLAAGLERSESPLLHKSLRPYLRDLYDNIVHIIDTIEVFREAASGLLDMHLSVASNRMSEIMKVLTLIATIFIPLTFIAGVYGMNFKHMPELEWRHGYFLVLGVMTLIGVAMLAFFRRHRWL